MGTCWTTAEGCHDWLLTALMEWLLQRVGVRSVLLLLLLHMLLLRRHLVRLLLATILKHLLLIISVEAAMISML